MYKPPPSRDYRQVVGSFFERLARKLIRADNCLKPDGDFAVWPINTGVEVKGGDNNHSFRISLPQLDEHVKSAQGFPFDSYVYCLFKYNNREKLTESKGKTRKSLLSKCRNEDEVCLRLALGDIRLFILDIDILLAMAQRIGQSGRRSFVGRCDDPVFEINHTYLERFVGEPTEVLKELGLDQRKLRVRHTETIVPVADLLVRTMTIPVTFVLKPSLSVKMESVYYPKSRDSGKPIQLTAA